MRILFLGCQKIAVDVLDFIKTTEHNIVGVVTHDEERDRIFGNVSLSEYCFAQNIPSIRFDGKINFDLLNSLKPDIMFSIYYRNILSKKIIDIAPMGCINLHPALLPKYRGPNPTYWVVRNNDKYAGTTLHYIDEGMDTGDIIAQDTMLVEDRSGFELNRDVMELGLNLFKNNFNSIMDGTNPRYKQDNNMATCVVKFRNNFRYINWYEDADSIVGHIRAHAPPYAGSLTWFDQDNDRKYLTIINAKKLSLSRNTRGPGSFKYMGNNNILHVQTGSTPLEIHVDGLFNNNDGRFISGVPE